MKTRGQKQKRAENVEVVEKSSIKKKKKKKNGLKCEVNSAIDKKKTAKRRATSKKQKDTDSSLSEWEDVEEVQPSCASQFTSVEVTLKQPESEAERNRFLHLRRYLRRIVRMRMERVNKALILCYVAHGRFWSQCCSNSLLWTLAESLVPESASTFGKGSRNEVTLMTHLVRWFRHEYPINKTDDLPVDFLLSHGSKRLNSILRGRLVFDERDQAMAFVTIVRSIGLDVRLVLALHSNVFSVSSLLAEDFDSLMGFRGNTKEKSSSKCSSTHFKYWPEVYLSSEEKWFTVNLTDNSDLISGKALTLHSGDALAYCVAIDKDHAVKDVTMRYALNYGTRKYRQCRIDDNWWQKFLQHRMSELKLRNRLEDILLEKEHQERPLPKRLVEYKNHPLYALERDLLKFEALYPKDVKPIGKCSKLAVYPRSAVARLNGKEAWIREGRVIKPGEEPYKIVKARPKMNVPKEKREDRPLHLFGLWQTEEYVPPEAKNGIVPRNDFGNIELYQMTMLPKGTAYLNVPGILTIAKKLNIDAVPAVVGWEFHCRSSHPILEGVVVCEENKDLLLSAWREESIIAANKKRERRLARALNNWRRLCRGLLIKKMLGKTFLNSEGGNNQSPASSQCQPVTAWPQCRHEFAFDECLSD